MASSSGNIIHVLPPYLINRIAAGEVIERPASVVKELLENAIDADATRIEVIVNQAGRNICIADNGKGMTPEDGVTAFLNHATSKIKDADDLNTIETLGFRGEALASIASISKFTCRTRTALAKQGTCITFSETGEPSVKEVGCAVGTIMEVEDLFYNTPARLKFLKRAQTELAHIEETVQMLALSHPEVQVKLIINEKTLFETSGNGELKHVLNVVYKLSQNPVPLVPVASQDDEYGFQLAGYVSEPGYMKSSRRWMTSFVNGRLVRCPVLQKAIEMAYESLLPHGRYPFSVLFLTVPADRIDVNVHPAKREIRYAEANTIFAFMRGGIRNALMAHGECALLAPVTSPENNEDDGPQQSLSSTDVPQPPRGNGLMPEVSGHGLQPTPVRAGYVSPPVFFEEGRSHRLPLSRPSENVVQAALGLYQPLQNGQAEVEAEAPSQNRFKVLNQLFQTYILLETPQGLIVVDQHIASERTVFERLSRNFLQEEPAVQRLVTSLPVPASPLQCDLLRQSTAQMAKLGFLYTVDEAAGLVTLMGYPLVYQERDKMFINGGLFENLLAQLEETGTMALDVDLLIATLACHTAVRAGDTLSLHDMQTVIEHWLDCTLPWTCPHGRPIAHTISKEELNHFFHRPSLPVNAV